MAVLAPLLLPALTGVGSRPSLPVLSRLFFFGWALGSASPSALLVTIGLAVWVGWRQGWRSAVARAVPLAASLVALLPWSLGFFRPDAWSAEWAGGLSGLGRGSLLPLVAFPAAVLVLSLLPGWVGEERGRLLIGAGGVLVLSAVASWALLPLPGESPAVLVPLALAPAFLVTASLAEAAGQALKEHPLGWRQLAAAISLLLWASVGLGSVKEVFSPLGVRLVRRPLPAAVQADAGSFRVLWLGREGWFLTESRGGQPFFSLRLPAPASLYLSKVAASILAGENPIAGRCLALLGVKYVLPLDREAEEGLLASGGLLALSTTGLKVFLSPQWAGEVFLVSGEVARALGGPGVELQGLLGPGGTLALEEMDGRWVGRPGGWEAVFVADPWGERFTARAGDELRGSRLPGLGVVFRLPPGAREVEVERGFPWVGLLGWVVSVVSLAGVGAVSRRV